MVASGLFTCRTRPSEPSAEALSMDRSMNSAMIASRKPTTQPRRRHRSRQPQRPPRRRKRQRPPKRRGRRPQQLRRCRRPRPQPTPASPAPAPPRSRERPSRWRASWAGPRAGASKGGSRVRFLASSEAPLVGGPGQPLVRLAVPVVRRRGRGRGRRRQPRGSLRRARSGRSRWCAEAGSVWGRCRTPRPGPRSRGRGGSRL